MNSDYYYGYDEGYTSGQAQAKTDQAFKKGFQSARKGDGIPSSLFGLLFSLLYTVILHSGALVLAYALLKKFEIAGGASTWLQTGIVVLLAYGIACGLFFGKGLLVSLKAKGNSLWLPVWVLLFALACALPVYVLQVILSGFFAPKIATTSSNHEIWAWALSCLAGMLILFRYKLGSEGSPFLLGWAYQMGRSLGGR